MWLAALLGLLILGGLRFVLTPRTPLKRHRAVVVVGGDFARSPRMQYHAVSLADCGLYDEVVCVGLDFGNKCCEGIQSRLAANFANGRPPAGKGVITLSLYASSGRRPDGNWVVSTAKRVLGFVYYFSRLVWSAIHSGLPTDMDAPVLFIQTPPAVPFVPLVQLLILAQKCFRLVVGAFGLQTSPVLLSRKSTSLVVDWHNFGFTLLAIDRRPKPIVWLYKTLERYACAGSINLTVSGAMKQVLSGQGAERKEGFRLTPSSVTVVPDTAPAFFSPCSRREFIDEVVVARKSIQPPAWFMAADRERGLVLVSSTSWTADDDYTMLVDSLKAVDGPGLAMPIWVVVSGKGETRAVFEKQIQSANLSSKIQVDTVYFQNFKDYARMLGVADAGISLHKSSSGWDLPMKVVDMFGCGLPVMAVDYPALGELVTSECGWVFDTTAEMTSIIKVIADPAKGPAVINTKKEYVAKHRAAKWDATWTRAVVPLLKAL